MVYKRSHNVEQFKQSLIDARDVYYSCLSSRIERNVATGARRADAAPLGQLPR